MEQNDVQLMHQEIGSLRRFLINYTAWLWAYDISMIIHKLGVAQWQINRQYCTHYQHCLRHI